MVQTIQGHFLAGQFVPTQKTAIPDLVEVFVIITDKAVVQAETSKEERIEKRLKAAEAITGIIPSDFEFDLEDLRRERIEKWGLVE